MRRRQSKRGRHDAPIENVQGYRRKATVPSYVADLWDDELKRRSTTNNSTRSDEIIFFDRPIKLLPSGSLLVVGVCASAPILTREYWLAEARRDDLLAA